MDKSDHLAFCSFLTKNFPLVNEHPDVAGLKAGLVLVRKEGRNHPGADQTITSEQTWTGERIRFLTRSFDLNESDRILVVDDWATTGNTIRVAKKFIDEIGATYIGSSVIVNKSDTQMLEALNVAWLVNFDDLA